MPRKKDSILELGETSKTMDSITIFIQIGKVTEEKKLNLLIICLTHTDSKSH